MFKTKRLVRGSALLAAFFACSCSLFVNLDGLRDTAADAGSRNDSSSPVESYCSNVDAAFCEDFDESENTQGSFEQTIVTTGASINIDSEIYASAPHALLSKTGPQVTSVTSSAALTTSLANNAADQVGLAFDVNPQVVDATLVTFGALGHGSDDATANGGVAIALDGNHGTYVLLEDVETRSYVTPLSQKFALQSWTHVELRVTFGEGDGGADVASVFINGLPRMSTPLHASFRGDPRVEASVGVYYSGGTTTGSAVVFDNVRLDGR